MLRTNCNNFTYMLNAFAASFPRCYCKERKLISRSEQALQNTDNAKLPIAFFIQTIGANYTTWKRIFDKNPSLRSISADQLKNSFDMLKKLNFTSEDVLLHPMVLLSNEITLRNRLNVLKECGFSNITIRLLYRYLLALNRTTDNLKSRGHIPYTLDMVEHLRKLFNDIELVITFDKSTAENLKLKELRQKLLTCYFTQYLEVSETDIKKIWKVYELIKHKSFESIQQMVRLLLNDLNFSKERLVKNAYVLAADYTNVRRIIQEIPSINGQDIHSILYKRPKLLMSPCNSLVSNMQHIKEFGIKEDAIIRCLEVLTLGPNTILERLNDLTKIKEFEVLLSNPRILRLVHYQNKARNRLNYLNQLKVRGFSLHLLSCGESIFERATSSGISDRTKGKDTIVFLAKLMNRKEKELRKLLSRHSNWCHTPTTQIKECYEYLISKRFNLEDIYQNIHVLLYTIDQIDQKLQYLYSPDFINDTQLNVNVAELDNATILSLLLYLVEKDFHFTGDGIWSEQNTQPVENFHSLLPDFPNSKKTNYKYGFIAN